MSEIDLDEIERIFDESWDELINEFEDGKWIPMIEKDLQLYLAHKLINRLSEMGKTDWVRIEFPVPLDPSRLKKDLLIHGRIIQRRVRKTDIAIVDIDEIPPRIYLIAEVKCFIPKFGPVSPGRAGVKWIEYLKTADREAVEAVRSELYMSEHNYIRDADRVFITPILNDLDRVSSLINRYEEAGIKILGYVCVFDLIYGEGPIWDKILSKYSEDKYPGVILRSFGYNSYEVIKVVVEDCLKRKQRKGRKQK